MFDAMWPSATAKTRTSSPDFSSSNDFWNTPFSFVSPSPNTWVPLDSKILAFDEGWPVRKFSANTNTSSRELLTTMSRSLCSNSVVASNVRLLTVTAITPALAAAGSGTGTWFSYRW